MYTLTQPALALAVACSPHPTQTHVISTGGGAFAAAAERPLYFAFITLRKPVTLGVMQEISYVYILASGFKHLYIGVTTEIEHRIFQHKNNTYANSFTARYNIKDLVYFERFADLSLAI